LTIDSAIRFLAGLTRELETRQPYLGSYSATLQAAKQQLALIRDYSETESTTVLQRDVILYLGQLA